MKAITLHQPYATLIAIGAKRIETRSWRTHNRGPLAIHAARAWTADARALCAHQPFRSALQQGGYTGAEALPLGAVVAVCHLSDCLRIEARSGLWPAELPPEDSSERKFGNYAPGRYMWLLQDIVQLPIPRAARGKQGFWEWLADNGLEG
ncbi:MAG TPA: ASCH domain-containing protein [Chloroflexota bacterium]|jgi:hypothetical protein